MHRRTAITARQLKWYNPKVTTLKSGNLRAGQALLVPTRAVVSAALDIPDPAIEIYGRSSRGSRTHVVRRGETLAGIAKKNGTSVSTVMRLNGLKKPVIHAGQELVVRAAVRRSTIAASKSGKTVPKSAASKSRTTGKSSSSTGVKSGRDDGREALGAGGGHGCTEGPREIPEALRVAAPT